MSNNIQKKSNNIHMILSGIDTLELNAAFQWFATLSTTRDRYASYHLFSLNTDSEAQGEQKNFLILNFVSLFRASTFNTTFY